jgi:hypothetical protein
MFATTAGRIVLACVFSLPLAAVAVSASPTPPASQPVASQPGDDLQAAADAFFAGPTGERYLKLARLIAGHPSYNPLADHLDKLQTLSAKDPQAALMVYRAALPGLLLSPRAHQFAARAAKAAGDKELAEKEADLALKCLTGIAASGDGSPANPYIVLAVPDEYDLIRHLGLARGSQKLVTRGDRSYDVLRVSADQEVWFDVTIVFEGYKKKLSP